MRHGGPGPGGPPMAASGGWEPPGPPRPTGPSGPESPGWVQPPPQPPAPAAPEPPPTQQWSAPPPPPPPQGPPPTDRGGRNPWPFVALAVLLAAGAALLVVV